MEIFQLSNFKIIIKDKDVYFYSTGKDSLLTLQWHYQKESKLFLLLDAIFKSEDFSFEDFSSKYYLSLSAAYLLKSELDKLLTTYDIKIDSNLNLSGNETTIRIFLYDVYFYSFNSLEFPFSKEIVTLTNLLLHRIDKLYSMNYAPSQAAKLRFYLAILFQRLYAGNTIALHGKPLETKSAQYSEKVMSIKNWFSDHTTLTLKEIVQEVSFIYSFLIAEQLIMSNNPKGIAEHIDTFCPEAFSLNKLLLKELKTVMGINQQTPNFSNIKWGLLRIHYKFLHFTHTDAAYSFDFDFSFFKENYPDFFLFIDSFIRKQQLDENKTNALKYDYLFLLIQCVPAAIFSKPIYICIDFSYGESYNSFILDNIQSFKFLNIVVEESLSERTALYLSDLKPAGLTCDYIIWKKPPLASDWEHFGNKVVKLKEQGDYIYG
ncbi:hypothetical protein IGL98_002957 [Enterococcus sp. DIV0840]|uniref:helix-turn-helix domain-containing protein n=1 Tax=Enterococcus TaxID=1350 RepID=UPI001A8FC1A4|nr:MULTISPECIES: helix-turn-helix domain-containing protein [Enterococcus]MBO0435789.1 helix-turn-helix domain-containing protein [Enterococcus sp. DIV0849a]MBO0472274.1 helix-turn-helix domain-containing protein [Enterococcus ureasiticus]